MLWTSSSGKINLNIPLPLAEAGAHPGQCDTDILRISKEPKIARQTRHLDPETLKTELREYGTWTEEELNDHQQNLQRILWLACNDIVEGET